MRRYAVIDNETGAVLSVVLWDGATKWEPPTGARAIVARQDVGPGWTRQGSTWLPPETAGRVDPVAELLERVNQLEQAKGA